VRGLEAIAMLIGIFMTPPGPEECTENAVPGLTRAHVLP